MSDPSDVTELVRASIPILGAMDIRITVAPEGGASAVLPLEANRNHFGTAYAGSLASAAEVLGGVLATTLGLDGCVPVVKRFAIDFRRPATSDVTARAELTAAESDRVRAEVREHGKSNFELTATLTDVDGNLVASTVGSYQLRRVPL